jgi:hypothetical protein
MDVPDAAGLDAALTQAQIEAAFWDKRANDLGKQFPDQFVAVYDGQVVAVAPHLRDVLQQLQAKGLDARHAWLRFLAVNPYRFVL